MTMAAIVPAGRPWDGTGDGMGDGVGDEEEVVEMGEELVAVEVEDGDEDTCEEVELDVVEAETIGIPAVEPVVTRL